MSHCIFCEIASLRAPSYVVAEDSEVMAFLEVYPARRGHCLIISKAHFETFETLPQPIASKIIHVGQGLAQKMKQIYGVRRVAFVFTGAEVPHAHAHVLPMQDENDVIFCSDVTNPQDLKFNSSALKISEDTLLEVKKELTLT